MKRFVGGPRFVGGALRAGEAGAIPLPADIRVLQHRRHKSGSVQFCENDLHDGRDIRVGPGLIYVEHAVKRESASSGIAPAGSGIASAGSGIAPAGSGTAFARSAHAAH